MKVLIRRVSSDKYTAKEEIRCQAGVINHYFFVRAESKDIGIH